MKRILFFTGTILSAKNPVEGGKNGETENTNRKGFGFEFWLKGKEETL